MDAQPPVDYTPLFSAYDRMQSKRLDQTAQARVHRNALQKYMSKSEEARTSDGFKRMEKCREALSCIDRQGYTRSFHQRLFHDHFIRACARIFWKTEPPGAFARCHQKILEHNGWDHLSQEILVSTPRRCAIKACFSHLGLDCCSHWVLNWGLNRGLHQGYIGGKSPRPWPRR